MKITSTWTLSGIVAGFLIAGSIWGGCGSSRTSVEGYTDATLTDKRLFVLTPKEGEFGITNSEAFAASRGIAPLNVQSRLDNELQTQFRDWLDNTLDSNLVVMYRAQPVGAVYPLEGKSGFSGTEGGWDWGKIDAARKEGAIDFLLVLENVSVDNTMPTEKGGRGKETMNVDFLLIDPAKKSVMTRNRVSVTVKDPREIRDTYIKLARELASKMPFHVKPS